MNILFLTNHLNVGGITCYVLTLSIGLKKKGHNVYIASSGGQLLTRFIEKGITYIHIPIKTKSEISWNVLVSLFKLLPYIKEKNIDIIHANSRATQVLGYFIQRLSHKPFVSTCHGFFKKRLFRKVFPCWGAKVIAISESVEEHLLDDFEVNKKDIVVVHNGIDAEKFQIKKGNVNKSTKVKYSMPVGGPVIGVIARLSEEKGHIYLIEAMKYVLQDIPGAKLLLIGEGRMKEKLVSLVKKLGIEQNVFFISEVSDTKEILFDLDVFVMPSLKEGLGLALMEAMASGLPVIGSAVGGIKNLIQDGYNGLLVKPEDPLGLAEAILALLRDSSKSDFLGNNASNFIKENFSQEEMVLKTERMYLECIKA